VWVVVGALIVAAVIWLAVRYVHPRWLRRSHDESSEVDEERDSVFTWSHLIEQLQLALARLFGRLRHLWRRRETVRATTPGVEPGGVWLNPFEDIRAAYRRVLIVARQRQSPRASAETPREFERRLSRVFESSPEGDPSGPLYVLTSLYQRVRYGDDRLGDDELESGHAAADTVVAQLQGLSSPLDDTAVETER
jgi:hypothetical protein